MTIFPTVTYFPFGQRPQRGRRPMIPHRVVSLFLRHTPRPLAQVPRPWLEPLGSGSRPQALASAPRLWLQLMGHGSSPRALDPAPGPWLQPLDPGSKPCALAPTPVPWLQPLCLGYCPGPQPLGPGSNPQALAPTSGPRLQPLNPTPFLVPVLFYFTIPACFRREAISRFLDFSV